MLITSKNRFSKKKLNLNHPWPARGGSRGSGSQPACMLCTQLGQPCKDGGASRLPRTRWALASSTHRESGSVGRIRGDEGTTATATPRRIGKGRRKKRVPRPKVRVRVQGCGAHCTGSTALPIFLSPNFAEEGAGRRVLVSVGGAGEDAWVTWLVSAWSPACPRGLKHVSWLIDESARMKDEGRVAISVFQYFQKNTKIQKYKKRKREREKEKKRKERENKTSST